MRCDFVAPFRDVTIFVTFVGQVSKIVSEGDLVTIFVSLGFSKGMTGTGERWRVLQMSYGNREYLRSVGGALAERWRSVGGFLKVRQNRTSSNTLIAVHFIPYAEKYIGA